MIGPPGCGKTYLAKAIATECGLPMLSAVGSEFVGIIVGLGASKIKALFRQARALAQALEQSQAANAKYQQELQQVLEGRLNEFNTATKRRHEEMNVRLGRVVDDANVGITAAVESEADTNESIVAEISAARLTERGATRGDDRVSEAAMEDRKKEGYS